MAVEEFSLRTRQRCEMIDITRRVAQVVADRACESGVVTVYIPHTTAGVTINENADPDVVSDMLAYLERLVPRTGDYRHAEGNSDAHIKSSMMGHSVQVLVSNGGLALGTWQGIYFCEFDGPRSRRFFVDAGACFS